MSDLQGYADMLDNLRAGRGEAEEWLDAALERYLEIDGQCLTEEVSCRLWSTELDRMVDPDHRALFWEGAAALLMMRLARLVRGTGESPRD